jgi:hypothetical protein
MADYIPVKEEEFLDWARNLYTYTAAHYTAWNVPDPTAALKTPLDAYEAAFATALNPNRGKVDVLAKKDANRALKKSDRGLCQGVFDQQPTGNGRRQGGYGASHLQNHQNPYPRSMPN